MRLIIHHWDADGICSAALLHRAGDANRTPTIGNYFLTATELAAIRAAGYDCIVVADMALHHDTLRALAATAPVTVYDHHNAGKVNEVTYVNPIVDGADEQDYPSASWVVATALGRTDTLLAHLGVVGDWEKRIQNTRFYTVLDDFLSARNLTFDDVYDMVTLLDANYKAGDKGAVEQAVPALAETSDIAAYIGGNGDWRSKRERIDREIERALAGPEEVRCGVRIKRMHSPYNIISAVARSMWNRAGYVAVVNCGFFPDDCQVYVRGDDCLPLIEMATGRKYVAGGKKNVMGAIIPKEELEQALDDILACIGGA
jgi:hypothetical protein